MAYMSRAKRRDEACGSLSDTVEKLREIADSLNGSLEEMEEAGDIKNKEDIIKKINDAQTLLNELGPGEFEDLKDEMESWASNMEGTNLEYTSKYETVTEAVGALEDVISNLESVEAPEIDTTNLTVESMTNFIDAIKEVADDIENTIGDAENIEFPGMYR